MDMSAAARLLLLLAIVLTSCVRVREKARDVAVTSFRVIDAPANYVRRRIDAQEEGEMTTTTTETAAIGSSDVVTPGRPVAPRPQTAPGPATTSGGATAGTTTRPPRRDTTPAPQPAAPPTANFPTARPVPGKPGFVYSVDPQGGIVDVTGYKSGDKAKDPYTKQIFIVP